VKINCHHLNDFSTFSQAIKSIFANLLHLLNLDMSFLPQITDDAFESVTTPLTLVSLMLGGDDQITDKTVKKIAMFARTLQVLNLWKCANITDEGSSQRNLHSHINAFQQEWRQLQSRPPCYT
jgi:hypothetical protein